MLRPWEDPGLYIWTIALLAIFITFAVLSEQLYRESNEQNEKMLNFIETNDIYLYKMFKLMNKKYSGGFPDEPSIEFKKEKVETLVKQLKEAIINDTIPTQEYSMPSYIDIQPKTLEDITKINNERIRLDAEYPMAGQFSTRGGFIAGAVISGIISLILLLIILFDTIPPKHDTTQYSSISDFVFGTRRRKYRRRRI